MSFFCNLPFTEMFVHENQAQPCCVFARTNYIPIQNYFEDAQVHLVKEQLLKGQAPIQCSSCVNSEKTSGHSFRLINEKFHSDTSDKIKQINNPKYFDIKNLIISTSNICNLKCLPCESSSYVRELEKYKLGIIKNIPILTKVNNFEFIVGLDLDRITLLGGEPFYDQVSFNLLEHLVSTGQSSRLQIDLNTNMTAVTKEKLDFLTNNFKKVIIKASIDGIGVVNDYLRYPSQWSVISNNIELVQSYPSIDFFITTALSNLSLLRYYQVIDWGIKYNLNLFISFVEFPAAMNPNLLPTEIKKQLLTKYQDLKTNLNGISTDRTEHCIDTCIQICSNYNNNDQEWQIFQGWICKHDILRQNSLIKIFPELIDYVDSSVYN